MDSLHVALGELSRAVARREEQEKLERRIVDLEKDVLVLKERVA